MNTRTMATLLSLSLTTCALAQGTPPDPFFLAQGARAGVSQGAPDSENEDSYSSTVSMSLGDGEFVFNTAERGATADPLVVGSVDPSEASAIREDLAVMSRIINKALDRAAGREKQHEQAMGIALSALPGGMRPQNLYLEGYGAVFVVNVRFPLVPPDDKAEEKPEKTADNDWERTKRELFGPKQQNQLWMGGGLGGGGFGGAGFSGPPVSYDADKVENLKRELVEALKNGSNIRNLKGDDSIVIAVSSASGGIATRLHRIEKRVVGKDAAAIQPHVVTSGGRPSKSKATMTIRAKKSDVDAFAKGKLDYDEFRKKVTIQTN